MKKKIIIEEEERKNIKKHSIEKLEFCFLTIICLFSRLLLLHFSLNIIDLY